jgi:hypothetical protein
MLIGAANLCGCVLEARGPVDGVRYRLGHPHFLPSPEGRGEVLKRSGEVRSWSLGPRRPDAAHGPGEEGQDTSDFASMGLRQAHSDPQAWGVTLLSAEQKF